jgi:hypothetical protein
MSVFPLPSARWPTGCGQADAGFFYGSASPLKNHEFTENMAGSGRTLLSARIFLISANGKNILAKQALSRAHALCCSPIPA